VIAFIKEIETRKNLYEIDKLYFICNVTAYKKTKKHFILNMFLHLIVIV